MQNRKHRLFLIFFLLTIINTIISIKRDEFAYQPYRSYDDLYRKCDAACVLKWQQFNLSYPPEEYEQISQILKEKQIIQKDSNTLQQVLKIASFLQRSFSDQKGTPSADFLSLSPLKQFYALNQTNIKLWCGNFAVLLNYFCGAAGITSRYIEIFNDTNHHVLNECYIPELKRWVMVDVYSNLLLVQNDKLEYLDLQRFMEQARKNDSFIYIGVKNDSLHHSPFQYDHPEFDLNYNIHANSPVYYFYQIDLNTVYSTSNKIKRYFSTNSWYEIYSKENRGNYKFYVKLFMFIVWILTSIGWLFSLIKR